MRLARIVDAPAYRVSLYALLLANTVYFALAGTRNEALDAAAWLVLLALFEIERHRARWLAHATRRAMLRLARLVAGASVIAALLGYAFEEDRLDAINSVLWIAVVILLEAKIRFPQAVSKARIAFSTVATLLYGGLALLVVLWAVQGMWFDAYDALLWLTAFATLELDLMKPERMPGSTRNSKESGTKGTYHMM
jgi:hypothetical protein